MAKKKQPSLLTVLPKHIQQEVKGANSTVKYQPKEQILRQEELSTDVYFINYGKVRITLYTQRGFRLSFTEIIANQSFGEMAAIDGKPRSANVVAVEETSLTCIPRSKFLELLSTYPEFALYVMHNMSGIIRRLNDRLYELSALDSTHRIYTELIRLAEIGEPVGDQILIANPPSQAEVASRIASHREAVNRVYKLLFKEGILEKHSKQLFIRDVELLIQRVQKKLET